MLELDGFHTAPTLTELVGDARLERIAIDIPIGLFDIGRPGGRACDAAARRVVGMRTASIFTPPARLALGARSYEEAKALCSMSRQSYGLLRKIAEVDALVTPQTQDRMFETHPEVAFAALYGRPWLESKKTPDGRARRVALLDGRFDGADRLARRRERMLHVDDVLDSAAAAIVAAKRHLGRASHIPEHPERDSRGLRMEIWY